MRYASEEFLNLPNHTQTFTQPEAEQLKAQADLEKDLTKSTKQAHGSIVKIAKSVSDRHVSGRKMQVGVAQALVKTFKADADAIKKLGPLAVKKAEYLGAAGDADNKAIQAIGNVSGKYQQGVAGGLPADIPYANNWS